MKLGIDSIGLLIEFNENINLRFPLRHPSVPGWKRWREGRNKQCVHLSMYPINLSENFPGEPACWAQETKRNLDTPESNCGGHFGRILKFVAFQCITLCWLDVGSSPRHLRPGFE